MALHRMTSYRWAAVSALALCAALACGRDAAAQTFTGSFNNTVTGKIDTATATFNFVTGTNTYLDIVLTNTSSFGDYGNNDILSGLFFAIATSPTLTPITATAPTVVNAGFCNASFVSTCSAGNVDIGAEWVYKFSSSGYTSTASTLTTTAQYGIAAAGYATLTPNNFGAGITTPFGASAPNLAGGGGGVGGLDFGMVGPSYNNATSANSLQTTPMTQNSVSFRLQLTADPTTLRIADVSFAYGTNPDGSVAASVPEPAGIAAIAAGVGALSLVRRARRRKA